MSLAGRLSKRFIARKQMFASKISAIYGVMSSVINNTIPALHINSKKEKKNTIKDKYRPTKRSESFVISCRIRWEWNFLELLYKSELSQKIVGGEEEKNRREEKKTSRLSYRKQISRD